MSLAIFIILLSICLFIPFLLYIHINAIVHSIFRTYSLSRSCKKRVVCYSYKELYFIAKISCSSAHFRACFMLIVISCTILLSLYPAVPFGCCLGFVCEPACLFTQKRGLSYETVLGRFSTHTISLLILVSHFDIHQHGSR